MIDRARKRSNGISNMKVRQLINYLLFSLFILRKGSRKCLDGSPLSFVDERTNQRRFSSRNGVIYQFRLFISNVQVASIASDMEFNREQFYGLAALSERLLVTSFLYEFQNVFLL